MTESLSKLMYAGIGALNMTRQRAEKIFEELVQRGQAEREHHSKFVQDMMDAADKTRKDLEKLVTEQVSCILSTMNIPTRKDFARLEEKIDRAGKQD